MNTENNDNTNAESEAPRLKPGVMLRQQRESLGWSQKEIADRLRLRVAVIESIEEDNIKSNQVATFTRGYLRSYARLVGMDEEHILAVFDQQYGQQDQENHKMQSFSRKTKREKSDSRIMLLTWGIMLVLAGISSVWWWQNQEKDTLSVAELESQAVSQEPEVVVDSALLDSPVVEVPEADVAAIETLNEQQSELQPESAEQAVAEPSEEAEVVTEEPQAEAKPAEPVKAEPAEQKPAIAANLLEMSFSSDCWILIKDATGKTLSTGVKKSGHTLSLQGKLPYNVVLGAPEGVTMTLADEAVDLSGYTAGKVAKFKLP